MATFDEALVSWTEILNDLYFDDDPITKEDLEKAFHECFDDRYTVDNRLYIDVFIKNEKGEWELTLNKLTIEELVYEINNVDVNLVETFHKTLSRPRTRRSYKFKK